MTTRTINKVLIRKLVKEKGSVELVAVEAKCSASLIWKLMSEEHRTIPAIGKIDGLCFALNKTIDELFPISEVNKESA
jgi:transcriptional regulator with XRE-family HTH domain